MRTTKIEPRIFDELKKILISFGNRYFIGDELNRSKVSEDLRAYDEELLSKLFTIDFIKKNYIKVIAGQKLFQVDQLEEAVLYDDYWDTSYTKYENRVGLTSDGKFIEDNQDIVLDFPFKDGVLTASMTKEDNENSYDDAFLNEVIEKDEIDRLFDKKILNSAKRYDTNGETNADTFDAKKDNLIIKGNNLIALHDLKERYSGKVKLIYLDPPYNTKNDSFAYNDKFNHSAWLTFMKNRLEIANTLLSDEGTIWITLDNSEIHYMKVLCDSIFGRDSFVDEVIWRSSDNSNNDSKQFSNDYNGILVYAKSKSEWHPHKVPRTANQSTHFSNPNNDPKGPWFDGNPLGSPNYRENLRYTITAPNGNVINPPSKGWRWSKETLRKKIETGEIYFNEKYTNIKRKTYLKDLPGLPPSNLWFDLDVTGHNRQAKNEQKRLFDTKDKDKLFSTPKPEKLLRQILRIATSENDLVLDFFMGSATTQAVAMKMKRRFIGIEQMDYTNTISVPRLQKVIAGEQGGISKDVNWQGGGSFVYVKLMQKNMGYLQDLIAAKTMDEMHEVYNRMLSGVEGLQEVADISFKADLDKIEWDSNVRFDDQKRLLIKLLDKNGLYYNYSEIDDENVREFLSDSDYQFNKSFYESGE